MIHHFDTDIAKKVGIPAACIAYCIEFWCRHNQANERNIRDGRAWVYNSMKAWADLLPYLTEKQIRRAIEKLREEGIVEVRNLNEKQYDQTLWYSYIGLETVANTANCPNGQMDLPKRADGIAQMGEPIPDKIPDKIHSKADAFCAADASAKKSPQPKSSARGSRLPQSWAPTPKDYAFASSQGLTGQEINNEADRFRDYWIAATGRNATKLDWEATWRNWIRNRRPAGKASGAQSAGQPRGGGLVAAGLRDISQSRGYGQQVPEEWGMGAGYVIDGQASGGD